MALDKRHKDGNWALPTNENGVIATWEAVHIAVSMDIRDELRKLNALLHCRNFVDMPNILRRIDINTKRPVRRKKKK